MRKFNRIPGVKYNNYIETSTGMVRIIGSEGVIGEFSLREAIAKAFSQNLDLVQISYENMPICKICDYNKYKYEISKKNKQKSQNNKSNQIKNIKLSMNIGDNDLKIKLKHAKEFLEEGYKVSFSARLRGREMNQSTLAIKMFNDIGNQFKHQWQIEKPPAQMAREINMTIGKKIIKQNKEEKLTEIES